MSTHATAKFEIVGWDQTGYGEQPALARATVRKTFSGDLEGESVAELLLTEQVGYLAQEQVTGTLAGRTGTFVVQHGGLATDEPWQFGHVVPGSGTGELAGLTGTATFTHGALTLDYDLG